MREVSYSTRFVHRVRYKTHHEYHILGFDRDGREKQHQFKIRKHHSKCHQNSIERTGGTKHWSHMAGEEKVIHHSINYSCTDSGSQVEKQKFLFSPVLFKNGSEGCKRQHVE